jgi:hypothetical protein
MHVCECACVRGERDRHRHRHRQTGQKHLKIAIIKNAPLLQQSIIPGKFMNEAFICKIVMARICIH